MNISSIMMKIRNFNEYIIDSGFLRDVTEFINTIAQSQNNQNMVLLKDVTSQIIKHLHAIINSDLPDDLIKLLPKDNIESFSPSEHMESLNSLLEDAQIDTTQYHAKLNQILTNIKTQLKASQGEINALHEILLPYYAKDKEFTDEATMSLLFKDPTTISNLKSFVKTLERWNNVLYLYHQLVSSKAPKDVELVNIQNGSLDVIINLNVNVAINFTQIVKVGLGAFIGYLIYKKKTREIVETYYGNKKLIDSEKKRETLLLDNIGQAIKRELFKQHEDLLKKDEGINKESVTKKIEEITKILTEHIVRGNDIKLLINFDNNLEENEEKKGNNKNQVLLEDTKKASLYVRNQLKKLSPRETQLLIQKYTINNSSEIKNKIER